MVSYVPRVGLASWGYKKEPPKVPDVGAGDSEGERVGEMLRGKERREAESGLRQVAGMPTSPCLPLPHCRGSGQKQ